ncbi:MAG: hypothetical protein HY909_16225 [Deltaproteobacteria bacterium]|nr:hypothetical protein [Deltaproteobacteria bacterium]
MHRSAGVLYTLFLLVGCGAGQPPRASAPLLVAATGSAPFATAAVTDATGRWSGPEWGQVVLRADGTGTYTSTYGTGPGRIEFRAVGGGYDGRWMESARRFGTMHFVVAPSGSAITGTWAPDPECTIGTMSGGELHWTRDQGPGP